MRGEDWSYAERREQTINKIVTMGLAVPEEHRADYLRVQIGSALAQSLRHGRSGREDDDPVAA